jgi:hypothetical protein
MYTWEALAFSGDGEPERVDAASITANLFPLLGVTPMLGRNLLPEEEHKGKSSVVLLGYRLWKRRFGGDRSIVGQTVMVAGAPLQVIGVMPEGFAFPDRARPGSRSWSRSTRKRATIAATPGLSAGSSRYHAGAGPAGPRRHFQAARAGVPP